MTNICAKFGVHKHVAVVVHALRLRLREVIEHGRVEAHAPFQLNRLGEANVMGDRHFDMLRDILLMRDRG